MTTIPRAPRRLTAALLTTRVLLAAMGLVAVEARAAGAADPFGTWLFGTWFFGIWLTEDGRVRTEPCGPQDRHRCGDLVWAETMPATGPPTDARNRDARTRGRPVLGHQIILGPTPEPDHRYGGRIDDADDGERYDVTVRSATSRALVVEGCLPAIPCGRQTRRRVADVVPGQLLGPTDAANGPRARAPKRPSATALLGDGAAPAARPEPRG